MADGTIKISTELDEQGVKSAMGNMGATIAKAAAAAVAALATIGAAAMKVGVGFESAFAGVRKTVDASEAEFVALEQGIRGMALTVPTAAKDLAALAESAGQLGIRTENILGFTRVVADLGVATNIVGQEGAAQLARFANIVGMSQENFDRFGSAIVALGNNFATTESEILGMAMRLAAAGSQVGMTEADILGFATALTSVGIEAEAGGSAFSKVFSQIQLAVETQGAKLQQFANVAGMSAEEFAAAFRGNATEAVIAFVKGLSDMERTGKSTTVLLDEMGIKEVRMTNALKSAANASGLLTSAISTGNDAWRDNTALATEAAQRYATTESQIELMKNSLADLGITMYERVRDPIRETVAAASQSLQALSENLANGPLSASFDRLVSGVAQFIDKAIELAVGIIPALISAFGTIATAVNLVLTVATALLPVLEGLFNAIAAMEPVIIAVVAAFVAFKAAMLIQAIITGVATALAAASAVMAGFIAAVTALAAVSAVMTGFIAAVTAFPVVVLIAGVAALVAGIIALVGWMNKESDEQKALKKSTEELADANAQLLDSVETSKKTYEDTAKGILGNAEASEKLARKVYELAAQESKSAAQKEELAAYVDMLNEAIPELNLNYDKEADALNKTADETYALIAAKKEEAKLEAARQRAVEIAKEQIMIEEQLNRVKAQQSDWDASLEAGVVKKKAYEAATRDLLAETERLRAEQIHLEGALNTVTDTMVESAARQAEAAAQVTEAVVEGTRTAMELQDEMLESRKAKEEEYTAFLAEEANKRGMTIDELTSHMGNAAVEEQRHMSSTMKHAIDVSVEQERIAKDRARTEEQLSTALAYEANRRKMTVDELTKHIGDAAVIEGEFLDETLRHAIDVSIEQQKIADEKAKIEQGYTTALMEEANKQGKTLEEYQKELEETAKKEAEETKKREETLQAYTDYATDMFNKIETKSKVSVKQMANNMEHNQKVINAWGDNILALEGKIDQGLLDKLEAAGPESAATVQALVNANEKELERLNEVFANGTEVATAAMLKQMGLPEVTDSGADMVDNIADSVNNSDSLNEASQALVKDAKTAMDGQVQASNFQGVGGKMVDDIADGASKNSGLDTQARTTINSAYSTASEQVASIGFAAIGDAIVSGIVAGVQRSTAKATGAISSLCNSMLNTAKKQLGIQSPSTLFRDSVGAQISAGVAEGISKTEKKAQAAAAKMAKDTYDSAKLWIDDYRMHADYSAAEEIAMWEHLTELYDKGTKERLEIDKALAKLQNEVAQESFNHSKEWVERKKEMNELSIQEEIEAWQRVASRYEEGTKQRMDADKNLAKARDELRKAEMSALSEMEALENAYIAALENRAQAIFDTFSMFSEVNLIETNVEKNTQAVIESQEAYDKARKELEKVEASMREAGLTQEKFTELTNKQIEAQQKVAEASRELEQATSEASKTQANIMITNLEDQIAELEDWEENIRILSDRGINKGLLEELRKMGPAANSYLKELTNATDDELTELGNLYQRKHEIARRLAIDELEGLRQETDEKMSQILSDLTVKMASDAKPIGRDLVRGIIDGILAEAPALEDTLTRILGDTIVLSRNIYEERSPSKVFADIGKNVVKGFIAGLESMAGEIDKSIGGVFGGFENGFSFSGSNIGMGTLPAAKLAGMMQPGMSTSTTNNVDSGVTVNFYNQAPINSDMDIKALARKLGDRVAYEKRALGGAYA